MNYQVHRLAKALGVKEEDLRAALESIGGELTRPHATQEEWTEAERTAYLTGLETANKLLEKGDKAGPAARAMLEAVEADWWEAEEFRKTPLGRLAVEWEDPHRVVRVSMRLPKNLLREEARAAGIGERGYRHWLGYLLTKAVDFELEPTEVPNVSHAALIPGELPMPLRVRGALESFAKERRQPVYKTAWGLTVAAAELL